MSLLGSFFFGSEKADFMVIALGTGMEGKNREDGLFHHGKVQSFLRRVSGNHDMLIFPKRLGCPVNEIVRQVFMYRSNGIASHGLYLSDSLIGFGRNSDGEIIFPNCPIDRLAIRFSLPA